MVEQLGKSESDLKAVQIDMALTMVTQALIELGRQPHPAPAVLGAVRNAVDRPQRLQAEFPV
jgi:hypothetical protein